MTLEVFQRVELDFDGLMVAVEFQPLLSYALVHNGVPPVRQLTVRNATTEPSPPFALRLDLLGPGELLSEPSLLTVKGGLTAGARVAEDASARGSYTPRPEQVRLRDFGMRAGDLAAQRGVPRRVRRHRGASRPARSCGPTLLPDPGPQRVIQHPWPA
jgi:hypothetical protein